MVSNPVGGTRKASLRCGRRLGIWTDVPTERSGDLTRLVRNNHHSVPKPLLIALLNMSSARDAWDITADDDDELEDSVSDLYLSLRRAY